MCWGWVGFEVLGGISFRLEKDDFFIKEGVKDRCVGIKVFK